MTDDVQWVLGEDGEIGIVRDSVLNARSDFLLYVDRTIRREYILGKMVYEAERRKHHLTRVWTARGGGDIRYYWRRMRVPWIVWAMFS